MATKKVSPEVLKTWWMRFWGVMASKLGDTAHTKSYWLQVGVVIIAGLFLSEWSRNQDIWPDPRYWIYQKLIGVSWREPIPQNTILVLIKDNEYWKGELAGRAPIK